MNFGSYHETEGTFVRLGRILLFAHLLFSPLLFQRGLIEVFEYPKAMLLATTAMLLLAGFVSYRVGQPTQDEKDEKKERKKQKKEARRGGSAATQGLSELIPLGMILFLSSAFFSTLFSRSGITSFYGEHENFAGLITIASYTILFFGTWQLSRRFDSCRTLLIATVLSVSCMTLYGIVQAIGLDPFTWKRTATISNVTRIFGTLGHPNHLAAFLVMGFPIVCYFRIEAWCRRRFIQGVVLMGVEIASAVLVVLSFSRGAWVAMVMMLIVFLTGLAKVAETRKVVIAALCPWMIGLFLGGVVFTTLPNTTPAISINQPETTTQNAQDVEKEDGVRRPTGASLQDVKKEGLRSSPPRPSGVWLRIKQMGVSDLTHGPRWPIWTAAFSMFLDHPLFGVGLDGFRLAFQPYRPPHYWLREWGGTPTHAHNEVLHIMATQGGFGLAAAMVITVGIGFAFLKILRKTEIPDRMLSIAIFAGITGFYITNLFSFTVIGTGTLFVTFAALLQGVALATPNGPLPLVAVGRSAPIANVTSAMAFPSIGSQTIGIRVIIGIVTGVVFYFFVIAPVRANRLLSYTIFNRSLPASVATGRLEKAVRLDSSRPLYFYHLGTAYRKEARLISDVTARATSLKLAKDALTHAIDLVPVDAENYIKLANLLVVMIKESPPLVSLDEVYNAIQKAVTLDPYNADYYLIGADIATALGDTGRAARWASKSIQSYPDFAPPHAQLGFIALIEAARLGKENKHAEIKILAQKAIDHLEHALPLFWANHTEKEKTARDNLKKAYEFRAKAEERLAQTVGTPTAGAVN